MVTGEPMIWLGRSRRGRLCLRVRFSLRPRPPQEVDGALDALRALQVRQRLALAVAAHVDADIAGRIGEHELLLGETVDIVGLVAGDRIGLADDAGGLHQDGARSSAGGPPVHAVLEIAVEGPHGVLAGLGREHHLGPARREVLPRSEAPACISTGWPWALGGIDSGPRVRTLVPA